MGATSVTGKGKGAAHNNKGPHNGRDVYVPMLSPHVVAAGTALTASGGTITVAVPGLKLPAASYSVNVTGAEGGASDATFVSAKNDSGGVMVSFQITGTAAKKHDWMIVTAGFGA